MKNINKYLVGTSILGLFITLFLPLIVASNYFFPFITGKNFLFRAIIEIVFAAWIILAATDKSFRPQRNLLIMAFAAFVAIIGIADLFGIYPFKSFWSNYERMEGWVTLAHLFAYFIVLISVFKTRRLWSWFLNTSLAVSIIVSLHAFLQLAGRAEIHQGGVRLDASFGNATYLAVYMLFHIFIVAYLMLARDMFLIVPTFRQEQQRLQKFIIGGILMLVYLTILYHTATRGAILGLIAGVFVSALLIFLFQRGWTTLRKVSLGFIIGTIVLIVGFIAVKDSAFIKNSQVLSRFASISLTETTTTSRVAIWTMALQGFTERPILGWGQENFNYVFNEYYNPKLYNQEQWFDRTHNVILDWLIAGGILGLAAYLFFYGVIVWYIWRKNQTLPLSITERSILTGLLVAYFVHNLFVFDNLISYVLFMIVAAYVYFRVEPQREVVVAPQKNMYAAPVVLVGLVLVMYFVVIRPIQANTTLISAMQSDKTLPQRLELFNRVIGYGTFGTPEALEQMINMGDQLASIPQMEGRDQFIETTLKEAQRQIERTPKDARYYVLLGVMLNHHGRGDLSLPYLQKAVELSPQKQTILFELGVAQLLSNNLDAALGTFKKASELDPSFSDAKLIYAAGAIYAKKFDLANSILATMDPKTVLYEDRILQAYYSAGEYKKVVDTWKARVAANPEKFDYHTSLAGAYLLVNDRTNAIAEINKAIKINPEFKEQGEYYIKEIRAGRNP